MSLLQQLDKHEVWEQFLDDKINRNQLTGKEIMELESFIAEKRYLSVTDTMEFSYPQKMMISKMGSSKKRTVYTYSSEETWVLKLLGYLLYRYDDKINASCYSFRRSRTAKTAIEDVLEIGNLDSRHVLKVDIHDYFNSIDVPLLMQELKRVIDDDPQLYEFICRLLQQDKCWYNGELIEEKRGAMAGVPLASFLANIYLTCLDQMFEDASIPYFRYSDDIIAFFDSREELEEWFERMKAVLQERKLQLNPDKVMIYQPSECFTFLGFSYCRGKVDLADSTIRKMKDKIRRKARKIYRYGKKKGRSYEAMARSMIRSFDYRFYDLSGNGSYSWTRFYFPVINCSEGLHQIDEYMLMYLRYLSSGRFSKSNYDIRYDQLKSYGYTPLVAEYYNWKEENRMLDKQNRNSIR